MSSGWVRSAEDSFASHQAVKDTVGRDLLKHFLPLNDVWEYGNKLIPSMTFTSKDTGCDALVRPTCICPNRFRACCRATGSPGWYTSKSWATS